MVRLSRILRVAGWLVIGLALVGVVFGLLHTWWAVSQPGLSPADTQRVVARGVAEALYNAALILPGALSLVVSQWARRRGEHA